MTGSSRALHFPRVSRLCICVWQRDRDVYLKTYKTNFLPPLLEPILYLLAFGFGLGMMVSTSFEKTMGMTYMQFIAPGMIALSVMNAASFECTFGSYVRMYYQKTFDAIVATPVSVEDVIAGEIIWGATKSVINAGIMIIVMLALGPFLGMQLIAWQFAVFILAVAFAGGLLFSAIGMCFTALVPSIDHFNYFIFLIVTPMMLLCGTFFPLGNLPHTVQFIAQFLPLTHVSIATRELALGHVTMATGISLAVLSIAGIAVFYLAIMMMRRRLVK